MVTLTRQELYDLVWSQAMTRLAKRFGLSDVALHKTCRKHNVPTPPQGHWAKKAHGKPVKVTPLPVGPTVSIGVQTGPPIGAQKGPPFTMAQG